MMLLREVLPFSACSFLLGRKGGEGRGGEGDGAFSEDGLKLDVKWARWTVAVCS